MAASGMTMMGAPTVVGAGVDCNNYIDMRNAHHVTDQATIRIDQTLRPRRQLCRRATRLSAESGFTPQNLPGFGALHDNFSQHGSIAWNRVINPAW